MRHAPRHHISHRSTARRILALAMVLCFVLFVGASVALMAAHQHHHCADSHCPTCLHLRVAAGQLRLLALAVGLALLWAARAAGRAPAAAVAHPAAPTLLSLRVKLNH